METIKRLAMLVPLLLFLIAANAQSKKVAKPDSEKEALRYQGGDFSLGLRNTISSFSHGNPKGVGVGVGGHMRLQLLDRLNTEWYADFISNDIHGKAHRTDIHVGWSVMFYVLNPKKFTRKCTPFVVAGHCFDESIMKINGKDGAKASRFSSAVQAGIGCSYNVTPRFDISLTTQYMFHLGEELDAHENDEGVMTIHTHKHAGWEGHLLISLSANYKIVKLWKRKA
jgi:hypothetical protein